VLPPRPLHEKHQRHVQPFPLPLLLLSHPLSLPLHRSQNLIQKKKLSVPAKKLSANNVKHERRGFASWRKRKRKQRRRMRRNDGWRK
jgi:hypothetical protein